MDDMLTPRLLCQRAHGPPCQRRPHARVGTGQRRQTPCRTPARRQGELTMNVVGASMRRTIGAPTGHGLCPASPCPRLALPQSCPVCHGLACHGLAPLPCPCPAPCLPGCPGPAPATVWHPALPHCAHVWHPRLAPRQRPPHERQEETSRHETSRSRDIPIERHPDRSMCCRRCCRSPTTTDHRIESTNRIATNYESNQLNRINSTNYESTQPIESNHRTEAANRGSQPDQPRHNRSAIATTPRRRHTISNPREPSTEKRSADRKSRPSRPPQGVAGEPLPPLAAT